MNYKKEESACQELNLDTKLLVTSFELIFKEMGLKNSEEAAAYYVHYICLFPKASIAGIHRKAEEDKLIDKGRSVRPLETGKAQLLKSGIVADVLDVHSKCAFGHEKVIPINPTFLFSKYDGLLREHLKSDYENVRKDYEEFCRVYLEKFGDLGIRIENGALTLRHSNDWAIYMILNAINNLGAQNELLMRVSGSTIFRNLEKILEKKQRIRLIATSKELSKEIIESLKRKYKTLFLMRYHPIETYTTSRLLIFGDKIGVDCKKLLNVPEPCYISTVYLDEEPIKVLKERFEILWNISEDVK